MREGERLQCKGLVYPTHNHTHTSPGPLWPALAATPSRLSKVDKADFRPRTPRCNSVLTALQDGIQGGGSRSGMYLHERPLYLLYWVCKQQK